MSVLDELQATVATQRAVLSALEPGCLSGPDALRRLEVFTAIERLGAAGRTLVAKRVEESNVWRQSGDRSAAHFIAKQTGTSVGRTQAALETAERLAQLPATAEAFRAGTLSEAQAQVVAEAAAANPDEERRLNERAGRDPFKQLRDECRRVRHAATDERARYATIRADRHLRTWSDGEGAFCGAFRTTPDAGARMLVALDAEIERVFKTARAEGKREPHQAYAVDALEGLVCGGVGGDGATRTKPKAEIRVLVDHAALLRGHTGPGEACEIEGLGPVPVAVVESWKHDAYLRLIVTDGIDVKAITRRSRYIDAHQDAALAVRDRRCVVSGCDVDWRLERDHRVPYAQCHTTSLDGLGRMCWWHHLLKTKGWALVGGPGCYRLLPPGTDGAGAGSGDAEPIEGSGRAPPRT
jgi:hypothetical protein